MTAIHYDSLRLVKKEIIFTLNPSFVRGPYIKFESSNRERGKKRAPKNICTYYLNSVGRGNSKRPKNRGVGHKESLYDRTITKNRLSNPCTGTEAKL